MGMQVQSSFTHTLYKFQCDFQKEHGRDGSLQGLFMRHLVGRIITIGVTLLLHAEAVCKVAAACFSSIKQIFSMSNEELLTANFHIETSKTAYDRCLKSFKAIFYREVLDTETFPEASSEESIEGFVSQSSHHLESSFETPSYATPPPQNTVIPEVVHHIQLPLQEQAPLEHVVHAPPLAIANDAPLNAHPAAEEVEFLQFAPPPPLRQPVVQAIPFGVPQLLDDDPIHAQQGQEEVQFLHSRTRQQRQQMAMQALQMAAPHGIADAVLNASVGDEEVQFLHSGARAQPQMATQALQMAAPHGIVDAVLNASVGDEEVQFLHSGARAQPQIPHEALHAAAPQIIVDALLNAPMGNEQVHFLHSGARLQQPPAHQSLQIAAPQILEDAPLNAQLDLEQARFLHSGARSEQKPPHQALQLSAPSFADDTQLHVHISDEQTQYVPIPASLRGQPIKQNEALPFMAPQNIADSELNAPVAEEEFAVLHLPIQALQLRQQPAAQATMQAPQSINADNLLPGVQDEQAQFLILPQMERLKPALQADVLFRPPSPIGEDSPVLINPGDAIELQIQLPQPLLPQQRQQNLAIDEEYFSNVSMEAREKQRKAEEEFLLDHEETIKSLSETAASARESAFPSTEIAYVSGNHIQPNDQWKIARGIVGNYNIGGCHFTNNSHGVEHLVSQFEIIIKDKKKTVPVIGIFDPQGSKAAEFLRINLVKALANHLMAFNSEGLTPEGIHNGISFAFLQLQQIFLQRFADFANQGSTATFVLELDDRLWVASVGSTGAVLSNAGTALQCSRVDLEDATGFGFSGARQFKPQISCYKLDAINEHSYLILGTAGLFQEVGTDKLANWAYANRENAPEQIAKGITYSVASTKPQPLACFVMSLDSIDWELI